MFVNVVNQPTFLVLLLYSYIVQYVGIGRILSGYDTNITLAVTEKADLFAQSILVLYRTQHSPYARVILVKEEDKNQPWCKNEEIATVADQ